MKSALKVRLTNPQDGWLDFTLVIADREHHYSVSYTPSDPIESLLNALLSAAGGGDSCAVFSLEPGSIILDFDATSPTVSLKIRHVERLKNGTRERQLDCWEGTRSDIIIPFWRALSMYAGRRENLQQWRHPFPVAAMERLTAAVAAMKRA
jgi:hypothetical protein